jgi:zinc/manganese transport system permease protein
MLDIFLIVAPALALCLLMILTHTYLGLHVLARGIVFVDLALAQVAALGASVALLAGHDAHGLAAQAFAFGAALIAAAGFAGLRRLPDKTTREVAIGCVYVIATALSIMVLSRSTEGMEELKTMLNGNILWVRWQEVAAVAAVYAVLAVLHAVFQARFRSLSVSSSAPHAQEGPGFVWEFLFFASFALVITLGVSLAGVLLVFALLIIPAFSAAIVIGGLGRLTGGMGRGLLLGYGIGLIGCLAGLWLSVAADLPTGATVVSVLGLMPLLAMAVRRRT